jgi:hypothetical protein
VPKNSRHHGDLVPRIYAGLGADIFYELLFGKGGHCNNKSGIPSPTANMLNNRMASISLLWIWIFSVHTTCLTKKEKNFPSFVFVLYFDNI